MKTILYNNRGEQFSFEEMSATTNIVATDAIVKYTSS